MGRCLWPRRVRGAARAFACPIVAIRADKVGRVHAQQAERLRQRLEQIARQIRVCVKDEVATGVREARTDRSTEPLVRVVVHDVDPGIGRGQFIGEARRRVRRRVVHDQNRVVGQFAFDDEGAGGLPRGRDSQLDRGLLVPHRVHDRERAPPGHRVRETGLVARGRGSHARALRQRVCEADVDEPARRARAGCVPRHDRHAQLRRRQRGDRQTDRTRRRPRSWQSGSASSCRDDEGLRLPQTEAPISGSSLRSSSDLSSFGVAPAEVARRDIRPFRRAG